MKKLVIISNLEDSDARQEDTALAELLKKHFEIKILDLFDDAIFSQECFFLIRNVWGRPGGSERIFEIYQDFTKRNIHYSNPFTGKGDQTGKQYLVDLYDAGYSVVPTFNDQQKAVQHKSSEYLLKPIYGGSSKGIISVLANNLGQQFDSSEYVIQPKMKFSSELSFFFVDNHFHHALKTKGDRWDLELYSPTKEEFSIASLFVNWNPIVGIQRIDFLKTLENKILLLELEDWCPYLSLLDVVDMPTDSIVSVIAQSVGRSIKK